MYRMFERARRNHNIRNRAGILSVARCYQMCCLLTKFLVKKKNRRPGKFRVVNVVELEAIKRDESIHNRFYRNFILTATERALRLRVVQ